MSLAPIISTAVPLRLPLPGVNAALLSHDMLAAKAVVQTSTRQKVEPAVQVASSLAYTYGFELTTAGRDSANDLTFFRSITIPDFAFEMRRKFDKTIFSKQLHFSSYSHLADFSAMLPDIAKMGLLTFEAADSFHEQVLGWIIASCEKDHALLSRGKTPVETNYAALFYGLCVLILGTTVMNYTGTNIFKIFSTLSGSTALVLGLMHKSKRIPAEEAHALEMDLHNLWGTRDKVLQARKQLHTLRAIIENRIKNPNPPINNQLPK